MALVGTSPAHSGDNVNCRDVGYGTVTAILARWGPARSNYYIRFLSCLLQLTENPIDLPSAASENTMNLLGKPSAEEYNHGNSLSGCSAIPSLVLTSLTLYNRSGGTCSTTAPHGSLKEAYQTL